MFVTLISFRGNFKSFWDLTEVSAQSWYKVHINNLVDPTFKISLLKSRNVSHRHGGMFPIVHSIAVALATTGIQAGDTTLCCACQWPGPDLGFPEKNATYGIECIL